MKAIMDVLRGVAIGVANIIPGVSGGTMAVSMGVYDKIIGAVSGLFKHFKQSILTLLPLGVAVLDHVLVADGRAYTLHGHPSFPEELFSHQRPGDALIAGWLRD